MRTELKAKAATTTGEQKNHTEIFLFASLERVEIYLTTVATLGRKYVQGGVMERGSALLATCFLELTSLMVDCWRYVV